LIQPRNPPGRSWAADLRVDLSATHDIQALLDAIVQRYHLASGLLITKDGVTRAQAGELVADLEGLARAIDPSVLPRYFANGPFDAYGDIVADGLIALLMRQRGENDPERSELAMVSDYNVAKEMMEELRDHLQRIAAK
jgi:hypothetical protein